METHSKESSAQLPVDGQICFTHIHKDAEASIRRMTKRVQQRFIQAITNSIGAHQCHNACKRYGHGLWAHSLGVHWRLCFRHEIVNGELCTAIVFADSHANYDKYVDKYDAPELANLIPIADSEILNLQSDEPVKPEQMLVEAMNAYMGSLGAEFDERDEKFRELLDAQRRILDDQLSDLRDRIDVRVDKLQKSLGSVNEQVAEQLLHQREEQNRFIEGMQEEYKTRFQNVDAMVEFIIESQNIVSSGMEAIKGDLVSKWEADDKRFHSLNDQLASTGSLVSDRLDDTQALSLDHTKELMSTLHELGRQVAAAHNALVDGQAKQVELQTGVQETRQALSDQQANDAAEHMELRSALAELTQAASVQQVNLETMSSRLGHIENQLGSVKSMLRPLTEMVETMRAEQESKKQSNGRFSWMPFGR